jgi:NAD(P)-dependent dehydrogenase (short-subunit alcohol dehydrogenase family)
VALAQAFTVELTARYGKAEFDILVNDAGAGKRATIEEISEADLDLILQVNLKSPFQAQVLKLLRGLRQELKMSMILITHDLGVIAEFAQRVVVMYAGRVVEQAPPRELFRQPVHPCTVGLIEAVPKLDSDVRRLTMIPGRIPGPTPARDN